MFNQKDQGLAEGGEIPLSSVSCFYFEMLPLPLLENFFFVVVYRGVAFGELRLARENALLLLIILVACFSFLMRSNCCWFSSSFLIFWYLWSSRSSYNALVLRCSSTLDAMRFFSAYSSIFCFWASWASFAAIFCSLAALYFPYSCFSSSSARCCTLWASA